MSVKRFLGLIGLMASLNALCAVNKLHVVGLFKDKVIIEIEGKRRLISVGMVSPEGVKLIAATSQAAILEIDGKRDSYPLGTRIGNRFVEGRAPVAVRIWPNTAGMYAVDGSINGFPVHFLVDTGATNVAMSKHEARRLGIDYRLIGTEGAVGTASGIARSFAITLKEVRVGAIELYDIPATVVDGDFPQETLLGMSFLGRLEMVRDSAVMELRKK